MKYCEMKYNIHSFMEEIAMRQLMKMIVFKTEIPSKQISHMKLQIMIIFDVTFPFRMTERPTHCAEAIHYEELNNQQSCHLQWSLGWISTGKGPERQLSY